MTTTNATTFVIWHKVPSLNKWQTWSYRSQGLHKKHWREYVFWAIVEYKVPNFRVPVTICFTNYTTGKRGHPMDGSNFQAVAEKLILDALVHHGILIDDSDRYVVGRAASQELSPRKVGQRLAGVAVKIEAWKEKL